jgi:hypothetical protein
MTKALFIASSQSLSFQDVVMKRLLVENRAVAGELILGKLACSATSRRARSVAYARALSKD